MINTAELHEGRFERDLNVYCNHVSAIDNAWSAKRLDLCWRIGAVQRGRECCLPSKLT